MSFLLGLKRFICTRRRPWQFWFGNASNIIGARNELFKLRHLFISDDHQEAALDFGQSESIDWCFIFAFGKRL